MNHDVKKADTIKTPVIVIVIIYQTRILHGVFLFSRAVGYIFQSYFSFYFFVCILLNTLKYYQ